MKLSIIKKQKNKIRLLFFLLIFSLTTQSKAQTTSIQLVTPTLPEFFTYHDLWNIQIVVAGTGVYQNFNLQIKGYDQQNGLMFTALTKVFDLYPGVFSYNQSNYINELQPTLNFTNNNAASVLISGGGFFPAGNYTFEYELYGMKNVGGEQVPEFLSTYTINTQVGLYFPPFLLQPENGTTYCINEVGNIVFCWTPAFLSGSTDPITYSLSVFQLMPGQTPQAAALSNPTLLYEPSLLTSCYTYPVTPQNFNVGATYAWQVKAFNNNNLLGATDVWTFNFTDSCQNLPTTDTIVISHTYYTMVEDLNSSFAEDLTKDSLGNKNNILRFVFKETYELNDSTKLQYTLYDNSQELVQNIPNEMVEFHDNFYSVNLASLGLQSGFYILEAIDSKGRKWYVRYLYDEGEE